MHELRFIGIDDDALIVTADSGEQFRLRVDDALRDALRPKARPRAEAPKVPPREIQQLIRAGKTAEEVVAITGADPADVERFEGPVRAERDYIVTQARAVAVRVHPDIDPLDQDDATFGSALDERLESLEAQGVRWDAWKDPEAGWRVSLEFVVDEIERDALWSFDPKAHALGPLNASAVTLSQQGELSSLQAPRLRAVDARRDDADDVDDEASPSAPLSRADESRGAGWLGPAVSSIGHAPRDESRAQRDETADLLEALRRRRGERDPQRFAPYDDEFDEDDEPTPDPTHRTSPVAPLRPIAVTTPADPRDAEDDTVDTLTPTTAAPDSAEDDAPSAPEPAPRSERTTERVVDVPLAGLESDTTPEPGRSSRQDATGPLGRKRGGRAAMPSWDEIVFGTRSDDDR
ncbi:DUF3071 domain-containing protein [Pseudoclavibacter chungangensis]|uniref:DUF3071 domain-containing protein n=1 Tax=Pseudoclavibacter chungangensis TaxID=587635 RepID=A0A7J5BQE0_9MICO|nr:septation protein SepH [Pseudoclavibacter chungangensis]KAB1656006.1 DUF3071 domain-containing protein [Pseudoclavibacter chungangensis]NYJ66456.1 hypothetical protein [Pseudoclavibacter chungangensis]